MALLLVWSVQGGTALTWTAFTRSAFFGGTNYDSMCNVIKLSVTISSIIDGSN
jgi:hypothetical protein